MNDILEPPTEVVTKLDKKTESPKSWYVTLELSQFKRPHVNMLNPCELICTSLKSVFPEHAAHACEIVKSAVGRKITITQYASCCIAETKAFKANKNISEKCNIFDFEIV